jgi:hypothetical protein
MRPDGTCIIRFPNGDVKCTLGGESAVGIVAYYHAKEKVCSAFAYCVRFLRSRSTVTYPFYPR